MENETSKKTSRTEVTRDKQKRTQPWRPPSSLDAPEAPPGFQHRWIRAETLGVDDKKNMSGRIREGFELVRADEYPDFPSPTVDTGNVKIISRIKLWLKKNLSITTSLRSSIEVCLFLSIDKVGLLLVVVEILINRLFLSLLLKQT